MIERGMISAQRCGDPVTSHLDQGLVINGHRHRLAHFQVAGQHRVVKVKEHRFVDVIGGRSDKRIVAEALVLRHLAHIK